MKLAKCIGAFGMGAVLILLFLSNCGPQKSQGNARAENTPAPVPPAEAEKPPIIDVHVHAYRAMTPEQRKIAWPPGVPEEYLRTPDTDQELMNRTLAAFRSANVVKAVASGGELENWKRAAPDLIIPGYITAIAGTTPEEFRALRTDLAAGRYAVIGEVLSQYQSLLPNDPQFERFFALAEELDKPISIHMGPGYPGRPLFRVSLGNPLLYEEGLVRHPKLRLCACHAGWPFVEEMVGLMNYYPQVYVDISGIDWFIPRQDFHAYLRRLVEAGYGKRIMFGSDNIYWPEAIRLAIDAIESADFLTPEQKRDIFYNNAARFFRLK